jgi:hypothetical protein
MAEGDQKSALRRKIESVRFRSHSADEITHYHPERITAKGICHPARPRDMMRHVVARCDKMKSR